MEGDKRHGQGHNPCSHSWHARSLPGQLVWPPIARGSGQPETGWHLGQSTHWCRALLLPSGMILYWAVIPCPYFGPLPSPRTWDPRIPPIMEEGSIASAVLALPHRAPCGCWPVALGCRAVMTGSGFGRTCLWARGALGCVGGGNQSTGLDKEQPIILE